jgi:ABC-type sugar transport system ATPase subunit
LSVRENLAYPLRVRHAPREEIAPRVAETARLLGIEHLLDRRIQQVSGGEQQRVAIGRAIVQKPNLYLLDEPISNLDASLRETVRTEVQRLQRQLGATTIMVTHDQLDALAVSARIAVLHKGVLQQCGAPDELYRNPANVFVASFIGQLRMNLLPCRYRDDGRPALQGRRFRESSGDLGSGHADLREPDRGSPRTPNWHAASNPRIRNCSTVAIASAS